MQLQEDKCRPRCMQLKIEASAELGGSSILASICLNRVAMCLISVLIPGHTISETGVT
jgi:hypothetical protein